MSEPLKKIERLEWVITDHAKVGVTTSQASLAARVRQFVTGFGSKRKPYEKGER